jgi:hypothetical protein
MADTENVRERLEAMLKEFLGVETLVSDPEGDYPVRAGSAKYYVRLSDDDPSVVRIYAQILVGVTASEKLYETLNAANGYIKFGRMFHQGDTVFVSNELVASTIDPEELAASCRSIAELADHYDDLFKADFGGHLQFEEDDVPEVENEAAASA